MGGRDSRSHDLRSRFRGNVRERDGPEVVRGREALAAPARHEPALAFAELRAGDAPGDVAEVERRLELPT